ncbi:MAG: hypothetical protein LBS86_06220 [Treponema sp.]|jgi:hypothetical protein|nr:hypothetical protein [Treponema sp.]
MKFSYIFFLFNGIVFIFLFLIGILTFSILGSEVAWYVWAGNRSLFLIVILLLVAFDSYFILNRRLYLLLEREDWPALAVYLHKSIVKKGRYRHRLVRLLAHTYLVLSDTKAVRELEEAVVAHKPALVEKNALVFGVARLLSKDITGAVRFFSAQLDALVAHKKRGRAAFETLRWIRWYYGFSLLLDRQFVNAAEQFLILVTENTSAKLSPLLTGLASFFLADMLGKALPDRSDIRSVAEDGREQVRSALKSIDDWNKLVTRTQEEVYIVILFTHLRDAGAWLYPANAPRQG